MGRGPGGGQSPFLRASSFCLRADEVSLIMTNLEKANQVRKPVLGDSFCTWRGSRASLGGRAMLNLYLLNYVPYRVLRLGDVWDPGPELLEEEE